MVDDHYRNLVEQVKNDVINWRRHLHKNPELSFQEEQTSQYVYDKLASFGGLELSRPTKTCVVARLIGNLPGRTVAVRADMDALPIQEENSFEFASQNPGVMHACGHDGHTAMLLGAAKILSSMKDQICGEVRFLFQHAEELFPGGAEQMVHAGVMEGVDMVIGAHLWSPLEVGKIAVAAGPVTAAPDVFRIIIKGKGGHAAQPHMTVDSIAIAAQVITNLQHIVSRNTDPFNPLVVSVTQIYGGTTHNVIPGAIELVGTVRSFNPELREEVPRLMEQIIKGVTEAHGATYDFVYENGYRPVINDERVTSLLKEALIEVLGDEAVIEAVPSMGGEDFSAFLQKAPGTFFLIGAGNTEKGIVYPHHHPRFTVDEDALSIGVLAFVNGVFKLLQEQPIRGVAS
ncbi:M20 family metallopeptidase [Polycladomyces subterraneus]|uniref:M20 family metallopeptidase n=1 Tax=Polycladomyces subterraneus TaxID=1016997 RepID=A0ABT8IJV7_9BACL|nr:M20 family metallopeptidase [Polycladomyces subterraneus]MDN4593067.1 M20 family metallopeptidase [Polycladomyces subterraneus]